MRIQTVIEQLNAADLLKTTDHFGDDDEISSLSYDSRNNRPGSLFFCKGNRFKVEYMNQAIVNGAAYYLSETAYDVAIPGIIVSDIRRAMAIVSNAFYKQPYQAFYTAGITGTKGKTTSSSFLKAIMDVWSEKQEQPLSGLISSTHVVTGVRDEQAVLTTPEALPLYQYLDEARRASVPFMTMEVSSQALKYHRTYGVVFDAVAFLNISEDHISPLEHPTFEDYFESKLKIFNQGKLAVLNKATDHYDQVLVAAQNSDTIEKIVTVAIDDTTADIYATDCEPAGTGYRFIVHGIGEPFNCQIKISGSFNILNALVAMAIASDYGVTAEVMAQAVTDVQIPGRMEHYDSADGHIQTIIDFAHNQLSLTALFETAKELYPKAKIGLVVGATGDKAISRRKGLAEAAAQYADQIIFTSDDPGSEDPEAIAAEMKAIVEKNGQEAIIETDRGSAIHQLFDWAESESSQTVLLFAGKGNETVMKTRKGAEPYAGDSYYVKERLATYDRINHK